MQLDRATVRGPCEQACPTSGGCSAALCPCPLPSEVRHRNGHHLAVPQVGWQRARLLFAIEDGADAQELAELISSPCWAPTSSCIPPPRSCRSYRLSWSRSRPGSSSGWFLYQLIERTLGCSAPRPMAASSPSSPTSAGLSSAWPQHESSPERHDPRPSHGNACEATMGTGRQG
jgi:hypothetical protein